MYCPIAGDASKRSGFDFDQLRNVTKVQLAMLLHAALSKLKPEDLPLMDETLMSYVPLMYVTLKFRQREIYLLGVRRVLSTPGLGIVLHGS